MTAQAFDPGATPFAAMEQAGHGLGKAITRQIQVALSEAQAARIREQRRDEPACPQCGQARSALPQQVQSFDRTVEFAEPKCF